MRERLCLIEFNRKRNSLISGSAIGGEVYVYLDGYVIPTTADSVTIEGWHSHHDLGFVPQVAAIDDPNVGDNIAYYSRQYWQSNRVERQEAD